MSECNHNCSSATECERCLKQIFEGENCALAYNEDDDWFGDEDEEFEFVGNNDWFENAFVEGIQERDEMLYGYQQLNEDENDGEDENVDEENDEEETDKLKRVD
ncbi:Hypothetical predicted protein [Paramuricea clavata]|uniref:Uncharacterized protein n=1 Tax=Paramuricea clavata TaxID=317549 RepID=A0A7D9IPV1_PARCT|nr:Hypothetical predicted protein [Paramuricea clavata]